MEISELDRLRGRIDGIDAQLLALFLERLRTVDAIGALKSAAGLPVRDEAREAAILSRVRTAAGEDCAAEAEALFEELLRLSRERQKRGT